MYNETVKEYDMMRKNRNIWMLCGTLLLLSSCEGERADLSEEGVTPTGEMVEVSIIPSGIALFGTDTSADADIAPHAGRSISRATPWSSEPKNRIHLVQDFDEERMLETIIEEVPQAAASTRASTLLTNTTLRVVVCNSKGEKVDECVYDVVDGEATPQDKDKTTLRLTVDNKPYTFHCYSPAYPLDEKTKTVVVSNQNENFAYAKTSVTTTLATKEVRIPTLKPMMSKVQMSMTIKDFISIELKPTVDSWTTTLTGAFGTSATWKLGNAALTTTTTPGTEIKFDNDSQSFLVYSGVNAGQIGLASSVTVSGTEYTMKPTTSTTDFTLEAGKSYAISLTVSYKNYIESRELGLRVAKGYYYMKDAYGYMYTNQGRLDKVNLDVESMTGDLFKTGMFSGDVCKNAFGSSWRVPNESDIKKFNDSKMRVFGEYKIPGTDQIEKGWYWGTTSKEEAEANQDKYVFLRICGVFQRYGADGWIITGEYGAIVSSAEPYPDHDGETVKRDDGNWSTIIGHERYARTLSFYERGVCITRDQVYYAGRIDDMNYIYQGLGSSMYLPMRCVSNLN